MRSSRRILLAARLDPANEDYRFDYGNSLVQHGKLDLAIAHAATNQLDVFRGNGDGTFATPTHPTAASAVDGDVPDLVAVDLTGDGKPDLLATTNRENTIAVLINRGDGTFPAPVAYSTNIPNGATVIVVPGDLSGRGKIDALVGLLLFPGNGDGTFGTPYAVPIPASVPPYLIGLGMALHDANHDGRLDLIGNNGSYQLVVLLNDCGIAHPVASVTPVISVGQNANVSVSVTGSGATPSGQITVHDGATAAGNGTLDDSGKATLTISGLAAGDHALTAEYSGEANYDPATSAPFTVRVTTATTTTTGSSFTPYAYGSYVFLDVHVTSSTGDTPSGRATLYIDGIVAGSLDIFYPDSNLSPLMDPGIHMLVFSYPGDATHPPSDSQPFPVEVTRGEASAGVFFDTPSVTVGMNGSAHSVVVPNGHGVAPGGTLTFKDGATLLATIPLPTASSFSLGPFLHTGLRSVTVSYSGDSRYQVAESRNVLAVLGTGSLPLEANYIPTQGVQLHFAANVAGAAQYLIMRRGPALNGAFGVIQSFPTPSNTMMNLVDWVPQPDSAYAYGVDAWDAGQQNLLASSPVEPVVATGGFADWTLTSAVIRAQHFTELASGINILRTFAGMPAMTFTDGTPAGGIFVRASHITDLRDALNAARAALGAPPISFSDPILVPGSTPIRTIHVQEIRDAL